MKTSKRLDGIGEYYFSQKLREIDGLNKQGRDIINLGIGSPDLPPHPDVIRVLQEEAAKPGTHAYQSYKGSPVLRQAMAAFYQSVYGVGLDPESEILPLIGSKEGILHICMTFLEEGDLVLVPDPGYPTYRSAVKLAGGACLDYTLREENNYFPDYSELERMDLRRVKMMFANYPHMPTGQPPDREELERLVQFADRHDILLVHDNPYSFILNDSPMSMLGIDGSGPGVLELNSLSKSHNMAGWRVGMLGGPAELVSEVLRFKSNMDSGMFLPVQLAAARALSLGTEWYGGLNEVYRRRRDRVYALLGELGCRYQRDQSGLFAWAHVPARYKDGFALSDDLLQRAHVFVTPGGIFGNAGAEYIRISLCSGTERLEEALLRVKNTI